jgi:hypothetical protein
MNNNLINQAAASMKFMLWCSKFWFSFIPSATKLSKRFVLDLWRVNDSHGIVHTIKLYKLYRLIVTRYMCGQPFKTVSMRVGLTKSGFPKRLLYLKVLIDSGNKTNIRFVLTLLGLTRAISWIVEPSFSSITDSPSYENNIMEEFDKFIPKFIKFHKIGRFSEKWERSQAMLSTKNGPHGLATFTAMKSVHHLPEDLIENIKIVGGENLYNHILDCKGAFNIDFEWLNQVFLSLKMKNTDKIRKISIVNDPELKSRPIAILDWFSQEALRPLHKFTFDVLRSLPQDRTFTQDPYIDHTKLGDNHYHSLDLSSATDRFPIDLQCKLIKELTDSQFSNAWKAILTSIPFEYKPYGKNIKINNIPQYLSYNTGQPMGAYSSWGVFTLCHHLVVHMAAYRCRITNFSEYILLGDDIVIYNDRVKEEYVNIMTALGVEVSEMKTHTSRNYYEFAKRWFNNGIEVSPIAARGFIDNCTKYHILYMNIKSLMNRNIYPSVPISYPDLLLDFIGDFRDFTHKERNNLKSRINSLDAIHRWIHDDDDSKLVSIIEMLLPYGGHLPANKDERYKYLMHLTRKAVTAIQENNISKLSKYVNSFNESVYAEFEGVADQVNGYIPPLSSLVKTPIYLGIAHNMMEKLRSLIVPSYDLKSIIKVLTFDDPSRVAVARSSEMIVGSESRLVKQLINQIFEEMKAQELNFSLPNVGRTAIVSQQVAMMQSLVNPNPNFGMKLTVEKVDFGFLKGMDWNK